MLNLAGIDAGEDTLRVVVTDSAQNNGDTLTGTVVVEPAAATDGDSDSRTEATTDTTADDAAGLSSTDPLDQLRGGSSLSI